MRDAIPTPPVANGLLDMKALKGTTGLEQLRAFAKNPSAQPPMAQLLGFWLDETEKGRVIFRCTPGKQHLNPMGTVHGGLAATLLDSALACSVHSTLGPDEIYTTVDLSVKLVRAILPDTGELFAEGKVVHRGRRIATADGILRNAEGKIFAQGSTTCMIMAAP